MPRSVFPAPLALGAIAGIALTAAFLTAAPAAAQTIGEIANQGRPIQTAPAAPAAGQPARQAPPGQRALPTLGEIAQGGAAAPQARAGCTPPPLPGDLPDGAKATEAQMRDAHTAFRGFVDGGQTFIECLDDAYRQNADRITVGGYLALTEAHNRMVAAMEVLANRFNIELREYRAKGGK